MLEGLKQQITKQLSKLDERRAQLAAERESRRDESLQDYWDLVVAVAENREVDPDHVINVLIDLDRTDDQLQEDADKYSARVNHAATLAKLEPAKQRSTELELAIQDKRNEIDALIREQQFELSKLDSAFAETQTLIGLAVAAERSLANSCWPWTQEKEKAVLERLKALGSTRVDLEDEIRRVDAAARRAEQLLADKQQKAYRDHNAQVAKHQRAEADRLRKQLDVLVQQVAAVNQELADIHQEKLRP